MNKLSKIFLLIIMILLIVLGVMTYYYFYWKDAYFTAANRMFEVAQRLEKVENMYNRIEENVTIEIVKDSVSPYGVSIIITDKNTTPYNWEESYEIQVKESNGWEKVKPQSDVFFKDIAYLLDSNRQLKQNINWSDFYGSLPTGTYKIIKHVYTSNQDIYFNSDEFEIK